MMYLLAVYEWHTCMGNTNVQNSKQQKAKITKTKANKSSKRGKESQTIIL